MIISRASGVIVLDSSALLAATVPRQKHHEECVQALANAKGPLILSPFVLAEVDYFVEQWLGIDEELQFLHEVSSGAYDLALFGTEDVAAAHAVVAQYRSLGVGLADASIVVLAERYGTRDILTLDERHFRAIRPLSGSKSFRLLPADA